MVNNGFHSSMRQKRTFALAEVIAAMAVLAIAMIPLIGALTAEKSRVQSFYKRGVAEQVLDGYREVLAAGAWRKYEPGTYQLDMDSRALNQLADSDVSLRVTAEDEQLRYKLAWHPEHIKAVKPVEKVFTVKKNRR